MPALPGMQYRVGREIVQQLRARFREEMPGVEVINPEDIAEVLVASLGLLRDTPRRYLPIIYAISFMVVCPPLSGGTKRR